MAHWVFVSHLGQGDASAAYGCSTATKNKACQIVKQNICANKGHHWNTKLHTHNTKTCTQAHLSYLVICGANVLEVSFWRRNTSSVFHNLQLAPKITTTESGFPEWGKQQNIAHGICPIVRSRSQSVNGTFPSNGKHRGLDNTLSRNRPTCRLVSLSSFGFHTNSKTDMVVDFIKKINGTEGGMIVFSM